jgi:prefoldin alpha subunit
MTAVKKSMKVVAQSTSKLIRQGRSILVPLTSSLYVPGTLKNAGKVLVDVGTGYYIEKVQFGNVFIANRTVK